MSSPFNIADESLGQLHGEFWMVIDGTGRWNGDTTKFDTAFTLIGFC